MRGGGPHGSRRARRRLRAALLVAIGALYALSIPWYRREGADVEIWLGLPDWVTVAVACYVAVAVLNCAAWLLTDVDEEDDAGGAVAGPRPGPAREARDA